MRARWAGLAAVSAAAVALDYVLQVRVFVCVFACVGRQSCVLDGQALPQCRQQQQALDYVLQVRVFVCVRVCACVCVCVCVCVISMLVCAQLHACLTRHLCDETFWCDVLKTNRMRLNCIYVVRK